MTNGAKNAIAVLSTSDVEGLVDGAAKVTRLLDNNPRPMTRSDMHAIYERLL